MAGQGITVSIQAKIEGWQDQIKQIQNAMKNIKPGADISKGLIKDLQQVNDMVNNLGKNMNQRLTSDSQITGFVDKIMQVEEVFGRLGTSMSHISFGDINPEYITAGFKDLLSTLEQANNVLGQGMESSFQNAIANSKTLQKEFERMKIDPKSMNINAIQEALAERGKILEKDVNEGLKKLTDFEKGLEKLKNTRDELAARNTFLGKDANATVQSLLVGHQLPTKGTILDADELEKQVSFFRSNLLKAGFTPTQLNHIIPDLETVMKAGHWDEMPSKFAEYLREAQNRTRNNLEKASQEYRDAIVQHQRMSGTQSHLSSLRFNNTQAQNEVSNILSGTVQRDTKSLRDIVGNLRQQLESAVTSGFKGLGGKLFSSSQQGMQDASAAMKDYSAALDQVRAKEQAVNKVQGVVQRYFSIYAAVRMVSKGIRSMMTNIKDLDKTITEIAIVTKMNQNDLWGQMPQYTKLAKDYAASISGVYKVSQLYYQQGLGQQDVMALTEQTLKMARISGLDYAEATDYMTNAVRSFKMEMTDAQTVVDVYSSVAASSASSVTELATAMSKTASSAAAVGSSFENTTAMLAVMIEATRESPENIGSAMKSIISRYGELKENKTGIDEEGEEYSLNKVDKALQTVGISIHDANGEFRDFDDVIFELADHWNEIDKNTQRYIATVMAGNRQQSRFLALVSSAERLKEESNKAANSENASQLQFLKTMDSIEAKTQQFQTSLQSLYTSSGLEKLYKGLLDFGNQFANTLENISSKTGLVGAVSNVGASFLNMATFATTGFSLVKSKLLQNKNILGAQSQLATAKNTLAERQIALQAAKDNAEYEKTSVWNEETQSFETKTTNRLTKESQEKINALDKSVKEAEDSIANGEAQVRTLQQTSKQAKIQGWGMAASAAGMALSAWANSIDINENRGLKGGLTAGSSVLSGLGTGLMVGATAGGPLGALVGILTALPGFIQGIGMLDESTTERIAKLEKNVTDTKNEKIKSQDELKTLEEYKEKYDELNKSQYESAQKKKEFIELSNSIAASYPELIKSMTEEGNYIVDMTKGYEKLAEAKRNAYKEDIISGMGAELAGLNDINYVLKNVYGHDPLANRKSAFGNALERTEELMALDYNKDQTNKIKEIFSDTNGIINNLKGKNTLTRLFGEKELTESKFISSDENGLNVTEQGTDILTQIYDYFISQAKSNIDLALVKPEAIKKFGNEYKDLIENFDSSIYNELQLRFNVPEYQEQLAHNSMAAYNSEYINLISEASDTVFGTTSNDLQKRIIKEELASGFDKHLKDKRFLVESKTINESTGKAWTYKDLAEEYYNNHEEFWYNEQMQSEEIKNITEEFNEFYKNIGQYTKADIRKLFPEGKLTEVQDQQLKWLEKIFDLDYEDAIKDYVEWLNSEDIKKFNVKEYATKNKDNTYSTQIGAEYISQIQSQYKNILSNTSLSEQQITDQVSALNDITDFVTNQDLDFATRNTLLSKYSAADFTSLYGIYDFIDILSNLDLDLDLTPLIVKVQSLGDVLAVNFEAEIDSYYDAIESSVSDFNKAVESVTSGTDLKTAREIADKMGIALDQFEVRNGKFYFDDIEALRKAYIKENDQYIEDVKQNVNDRYSALEKLSEIQVTNDKGEVASTIELAGQELLTGQKSLDDLEKIFSTERSKVGFKEATGISYSEFIKYYEDFQNQLDTGTTDLIEYMLQRVNDKLSESGQAVLEYLQQNTALSQIKSGNIGGFLQTIGLVSTNEQIEQQALENVEHMRENYRDLAIESLKEEGYVLKEDSVALAKARSKSLEEESNKQLNDFLYSAEYLPQDLEYYKTQERMKLEANPKAYTQKEWDEALKPYWGWSDRERIEENAMRSSGKFVWDESTVEENAQVALSNAIEINEARIAAIQSMNRSWKDIFGDYDLITEEMIQQRIQELMEKDKDKLTEDEKAILKRIRDTDTATITGHILQGDYSDFTGENEQFIGDLYEYASSATKSVFSSITTALKGGENKIKVTTGNQVLLQDLQKKTNVDGESWVTGNLGIGTLATFNVQAIKSTSDETFINYVNSLNQDEETKRSIINDFLNVKYPDIKSSISNIADKETISRSDLQTHLDNLGHQGQTFDYWVKQYGLKFNEKINSYEIDDFDQYIKQLEEDTKQLGEGTKDYQESMRNIDSMKRKNAHKDITKQVSAFKDVIQNYDNVTDDQYSALQEAFGDNWETVSQVLTETGTGEYKLDVAKLRQNLDQLGLSDDVQEAILQLFDNIADDYIKNITDATSMVTKGTTSQADISKFKEKAQQLGINADNAFTYDQLLQAWTLNPNILHDYVQAQAQQLVNAGYLSVEEAQNYINDNVTKTLAQAVDIKGFLNAENKQGLARDQLKQQLKSSGLLDYEKYLNEAAVASYLKSANAAIDSAASWTDQYNTPEELANKWIHQDKKLIDTAKEKAAENFVSIIENGGRAAVIAMKALATLKGEELTSADIEQAYRAQVSEIESSLDQITFGPGGLVSGYAVTILDTLAKEGKAEIVHLDANNAVIKSITDIGAAYAEYYKALAKSGEATLEALNEAKAKVLETQGERYKEQKAIDALGDAAGMTYTSFAAILSDAGIEMTDDIIDQYTESLGGTKMRIKDFASFARVMKWDYDSEEYTSALKTYNDSLVERNTQVKKNVTEELKGLESIKPGDWLNLTQTEKALRKIGKDNSKEIIANELKLDQVIEASHGLDTEAIQHYQEQINQLKSEDYFTGIQNALADMGAYFDDGILKISDGANILGIVSVLSEKLITAVENSELDIDTGEIKNLISNIIKAYSDAIIKGIQGSMTHAEAGDLITTAKGMGIQLMDTDFTETANGLKLSNSAATKLYFQVSKLNAVKGKLVFDELNKSLQESDSRFKDINSIMSQIQQLTNEINELQAQGDGGAAQERVDAAERELALAKEIAAVRLTTRDDESFNIKGKKTLATSTHNAMNYLGDVADIADKAETWKTQGYVGKDDIEDFSDYVTHLIERGDKTGEGSQFYGVQFGGKGGITKSKFQAAISKAFKSVTDQNGKSQLAFDNAVFLKELGMDLGLGFEGFRQSENTIQGFMTETGDFYKAYGGIFADMDYLSKSRKFGEFTGIEDLIDANGRWNLEGKSDEFKESLLASAEHIKIGGKTLADAIKNNELAKDNSKKAVQDLITLAETTDWELESGYETIKEHMQRYGIEEEIDFGDFTYKMEGNNLLVKDNKTGKYVTADGKEFEKSTDALKHMNRENIQELKKDLGQYNTKAEASGDTTITLDGVTYTYKINEKGNIEVVTTNGQSGGAINGQKEFKDAESLLEAGYQQYRREQNTRWDLHESNYKAISKEAWKLHQRQTDMTPAQYIKGGSISEQSRQAFQEVGFQTWQQVQAEWDSMVQTYGKKGAQFEWEAKYHTRFVPDNDSGEMSQEFAESYLKAMNLTQAAADVAAGIDAALASDTVQKSLSTAIDKGLTQSLKSEGKIEVAAPEIVIKPSKITVDAKTADIKFKQEVKTDEEVQASQAKEQPQTTEQKQTTQNKLQEVVDNYNQKEEQQTHQDQHQEIIAKVTTLDTTQVSDTTVTLKPEVEEPEEQNYEGTVTFTNEYDELTVDNISAHVIWTNSYSGPPVIQDITRVVHWKNDKSALGGEDSDGLTSGESVASARGTFGNARAAGTLMGELGPELVVSKGRYFVVGQSGPEMVDLADDAIVFNHLQTQSLLTKGTSNTRGKAITNERNAVAFATGSRHGGPAHDYTDTPTMGSHYYQPAVNSIFDKGTKEVFNTIENNIEKTANNTAEEIAKNFIKEFERWFNWLQKIAQLEKEITLEESKRSRYESAMTAMGDEFYSSQKRSLDLLEKQVATQQSLISAQYDYYQSLREQLNAHSEFKTVYTFDENFQPIYNDDYEKIQAIRQVGFDKVTGAPNADVKSVYAQLVAMGYGDSLVYDTSGNKIDTSKDGWQATAVQAFYDRMDKQLQEAQKLHDDIMDGQNKIEELEAQRNEIMRAIEQNQITVENKVMKALEESRQREIDELQKERDAIEKSSQKLIDGLNDQLQKEQDMYNQQKDADELATLQRQLAILQRSGGSAAQIADLQNQIADKQKTMYFDTQQKQIDAVEEASKNQLERLDHQIDLMQETLDYQKEYGLLWGEVSDILSGTKENILAFISGNTSEYWNKYTTELNSILRQDEFEIQQYKANQADQNGTFTSTTGSMNYLQGATTAVTGTGNGGTGSGTGGRGGNSGSARTGKYQTPKEYQTFNGQPFNPEDINYTLIYYTTNTGEMGVVSGYGIGPNNSDEDQAYAKLQMLMDKLEGTGVYIEEFSQDQSDLSLMRANSLSKEHDWTDMWYDENWDGVSTPTFEYTDANGVKHKRVWSMANATTGAAVEDWQKAAIEYGGIGNIPIVYGDGTVHNASIDYTRRGVNGKYYNTKDAYTTAYNAIDEKQWEKLSQDQKHQIADSLVNGLAEGVFSEKDVNKVAQQLASAALNGTNVKIINPNGVRVPTAAPAGNKFWDGMWYNVANAENDGEYLKYMEELASKYTYLVGKAPEYVDTLPVKNVFHQSVKDQYGDAKHTDVEQQAPPGSILVPSEIIAQGTDAVKAYINDFIASNGASAKQTADAIIGAAEKDKIATDGVKDETKKVKGAIDEVNAYNNKNNKDQLKAEEDTQNTIIGTSKDLRDAINESATSSGGFFSQILSRLDTINQREEDKMKQQAEEQAELQQAMVDQGAASQVEQLLREHGEYDNKDQHEAAAEAARAAAEAAFKKKIEDGTAATITTGDGETVYIGGIMPDTRAMAEAVAAMGAKIIKPTTKNIKGQNLSMALAKGTLLGELGPEAYVSNGTMHIAGLHGAEFVDLPDDAIVFNHLQTARLLQTGMTSRGTPTTSEEAAAGETRQTYLDTFWQSVNSNSSAIQRANTTNYSIPGLNENSIINNSNNGQTVTIERAEVNLQIEKLANDYDSRRAADQVMEEMLRIASKTSMNNSRGRG